jgi:3-deoxy-D-manno-octulosonic-acid transferase
MKERELGLRAVLTTTTTTGFALARRQAPDWIEVLYTPLDFWPIMRRAFDVIRPARIVLVEAEVWPNLTALAHRRRIPLALVNARLSPRSEARFRKFNFFLRSYFRKLDLVCVQEPEDVARWESLGARSSQIHLVGSIKYDPENEISHSDAPRAALQNLGIAAERPVLLAGSTHPGEEEILGRVFLQLRAEFPDLFLIIAPRHVERTAEISTRLRALGVSTARRTQPSGNATDSLLLDTTGELRDWYSIASIVFIGKSLAARGGQNPVEGIVAGQPVVFGPHMENFAQLARSLVATGGAVQANDEAELTSALADLLRDRRRREHLVERAQAVVQRHRGATERTAQRLEQLRVRTG